MSPSLLAGCGIARTVKPIVASAKVQNGGDAPAARSPGPNINVIPVTRWEKGIPPVMGAHLMASGVIAPVSTSKGAGIDVQEHIFTYPDGEYSAQILLYTQASAAYTGLGKLTADAAAKAISEKGSFTLVLSGGSLISGLSGLLGSKNVDWSKWWVFFVDERNVPHSSPDSNYKGALDAFLSKVGIPQSQVFAIKEDLPVDKAATEYEGRLLGLPQTVLPRTGDGLPVFDLTLLGIGPDGHVASLFPNHPALAERSKWVLPISDSPKPPPERITFSLPVINSSKNLSFVALGEGKAEIVQRALEVQALPGALPAQLVRPHACTVNWLLDVASAQNLNIAEWNDKKAFPRSS